MTSSPLKRPVVIVTGGSRGIGAATAQALAKAGSSVIVTGRSEKALQDVAAGITTAGGDAVVVAGDLAEPSVAERIIEKVATKYGRLDCVISNAGAVHPIGATATGDLDEWRRAYELQVFAPIRLLQLALPSLRTSRGRVISVSTEAAGMHVAALGCYTSSKAAMLQALRVLSVEEPQVAFISFFPGTADTEMMRILRDETEGIMSPEKIALYRRLNADGLLTSPESVGRTLAYLALNAPSEATGQTLAQDHSVVQYITQHPVTVVHIHS